MHIHTHTQTHRVSIRSNRAQTYCRRRRVGEMVPTVTALRLCISTVMMVDVVYWYWREIDTTHASGIGNENRIHRETGCTSGKPESKLDGFVLVVIVFAVS